MKADVKWKIEREGKKLRGAGAALDKTIEENFWLVVWVFFFFLTEEIFHRKIKTNISYKKRRENLIRKNKSVELFTV